SERLRVAVLGHTCMHGGSSQCMQPTGTKARFTAGYSPISRSSTRRHCTPGGVPFACLQAAVQVWQPTQRRRSATIAQRVMILTPCEGGRERICQMSERGGWCYVREPHHPQNANPPFACGSRPPSQGGKAAPTPTRWSSTSCRSPQ